MNIIKFLLLLTLLLLTVYKLMHLIHLPVCLFFEPLTNIVRKNTFNLKNISPPQRCEKMI